MRKEKSKSGKVKMCNNALFIGIVAIVLTVAAIGATANNNTEASDKVNVLDVPHKINYQGYLTDTDGNQITGDLDMTFKIYDSPTGGTPLWSETQTSVHVEKGLFNVILGSVNPIPGDVFPSGESRWLETEIERQTLTPRKEIVSVAYAFKADPDNDWDGACTGEMYTHCPDNVSVIGGPGSYIKVGMPQEGYWTTFSYEYDGSMYDTYIRNPCGKGDGCDLILDFPYGNVGIGTTAPSEKLDVEGNIHASGSIKSGNTLIIDGPNDRILTTSGEMYFGRGLTGAFEDVKVGIGTTLPRKKLEVYNQGSAAIRLHGEARHSTAVDLIAVPADVLPDGFDKFLINVDDVTRFVIHSNGNVGIGKTFPSEKLHVNGNIKATGKLIAGDGITIDGVNNKIEVSSPPDNNLRIMADNVGIGTTDPHSTLHIDGSVATAFKPVGPSAAPYDLTASDCIIAADAPLLIQLPTAVGIAGRIYTIKRIDPNAFLVEIQPVDDQMIDGQTSYSLVSQWSYVTIVSDGANWLIIAEGR